MSALAQSMLRIVTFGAANAGWGAAWDGAERQLVLAGDRLNVAGEFELEGAAAEDDWRLLGDGISLAIVPTGEAATNPELGGFDQLCRVHGETTIDGVRQA